MQNAQTQRRKGTEITQQQAQQCDEAIELLRQAQALVQAAREKVSRVNECCWYALQHTWSDVAETRSALAVFRAHAIVLVPQVSSLKPQD